MNLSHRIADRVRDALTLFTPIPKVSQFADKGILTPQEFVEAGDQLVFRFPTWQWQSSDKRYNANWLPSNKQYLITRNIPCKSRVRELDFSLEGNVHSDPDGDWFLPGDVDDTAAEDILDSGGEVLKEEILAPIVKMDVEYVKSKEATKQKDEDGVEMNFFEDVDLLLHEEDPAAADVRTTYFVREVPDARVLHTRTYDVSVTYDKYYQTPRLWLFGYNENGVPLKPEQIFEDILTVYVSKTVTVDPHPCTGIPSASIHPCKHAEVMKKVIGNWKTRGLELRPDLAVFVILKFISSVIPTIEYDFTMDIEMAI